MRGVVAHGCGPTSVKEMERCVIKAVYFADLSIFHVVGWGLKGMEWRKSTGIFFFIFYFLIFKNQVDKNNKMDPIKSHGVHDTET